MNSKNPERIAAAKAMVNDNDILRSELTRISQAAYAHMPYRKFWERVGPPKATYNKHRNREFPLANTLLKYRKQPTWNEMLKNLNLFIPTRSQIAQAKELKTELGNPLYSEQYEQIVQLGERIEYPYMHFIPRLRPVKRWNCHRKIWTTAGYYKTWEIK